MSATTRDCADAVAGRRVDVVAVTTPGDRLAMLEIRRRVFAVEQQVATLQVSDPDDGRSLTALAYLEPDEPGGQRRAVSTGRLTLGFGPQGQGMIAWVATLPEDRGHGFGGAVMRFLLAAADDAGAPEVILAAQAHAEHFYLRLGFERAGPLYDVRGIKHRRMIRARPH